MVLIDLVSVEAQRLPVTTICGSAPHTSCMTHGRGGGGGPWVGPGSGSCWMPTRTNMLVLPQVGGAAHTPAGGSVHFVVTL